MQSTAHRPSPLPVLARLKLTLLKRHFARSPLNAFAIVIVILGVLAFGVFGLIGLSLYLREVPAGRDTAALWMAWGFAIAWLILPLSQFDVQRSLDLSGLRLLPLSRATFTAAVMLDAVVSPMGLLLIPLLLLSIPVLLRSAIEVPVILVSFALLLVSSVALGQAVYLLVSRVLSSRRAADIGAIVGVVMIFLFQGINLLLHSGDRANLPPWLGELFGLGGALLAPLGKWLYPGLAAGAVSSFSAGDPGGALLRTTLLLGQTGIAVWLAGTATRAFYEGELESGGTTRRQHQRVQQRETRALLHGALGALFHRERAYLWRDPLLKSLFIQTLLGVAYLSLVTVFLLLRDLPFADFGSQWILLGITLMLSYSESWMLFNKLGLEGPLLVHTLLSPVSRRRVLEAKSLLLLSHFLALNSIVVIGLGIALSVEPLYIAASVLLLAANALLLDLLGNFVGIWFPFSYRRQGRRFRPLFAQTGCGYMLLYFFVTQLANAVVLPVGALIIGGLLLGGGAGLAGGTLIAALLVWLALRFGLPAAEHLLLQREPELVAALTKEPD